MNSSRDLLLLGLSRRVRGGLYLVSPHAYWIWEGKKTLVVKSVSRDYSAPRWLVSKGLEKKKLFGGFAFGVVRLGKPERIGLAKFENLKSRHLISDEERVSWWGKSEELFAYEIADFVPTGKPVKVLLPLGIQTEVKEVRFLEPVVKAVDPYLAYPEEDKVWAYGDQNHFRGRSVHLDDRYEQAEWLVGWTIMHQIPDAIKKPVSSMAAARKAWKNEKLWKINIETGDILQRKIRGGVVRRGNLSAAQKKPEPKVWLDFEGVAPVGTVGATVSYPGVLHLVEKGRVQYGAQKAYFHEYFRSDGKLLQGRIAFRLLTRKVQERYELLEKAVSDYDRYFDPHLDGWVWHKEGREDLFLSRKSFEWICKQRVLPPGVPEEEARTPYFWVLMQPDEQRPYVLSSRAVEESWLPPEGVSALPVKWRKKVPASLRFWEKTGKKRVEARRKLVEEELEKAARSFVLQRHFWRGPLVVRVGPSGEHWDLRIAEDEEVWHLVLEENPLETPEVVGFFKLHPKDCVVEIGTWEDAHFEQEGEIKVLDIGEKVGIAPETEANPSKQTPCWIEPLDSGKAVLLDEGPLYRKFEFKGEHLKGVFFFKRESEDSSLFLMRASGGPGEPKSSVEKELQVPIKKFLLEQGLVYGVVLEPWRKDAQGDWERPEVIERAAHRFMMKSQRLDLYHQRLLGRDEAVLVESAIAPVDFKWSWKGQEALIKKGSWFAVVKILSDELKRAVEEGKIAYFSIRGFGKRRPT